ncbi:MAG: hypothetical protein H6525_03180 [Actinobacteria bacterium]|nr:hypothetical protein [Actinomycetota bacterium]MCB9411838.1 hypothetical protein [Actinomycetota bacterium]
MSKADGVASKAKPAGSVPERPWPIRVAMAFAAVAALTLVVALRRPTGLTEPTIWAEDGAVFMAVAWQGPGELFATYAGQFWPLQRGLAFLIGLAPATWWPTLLYLTGCLGIALAAAVPLLRRGASLFGALPYRWLLALLIALLPGAFEAQGNITNLHWWAMAALLLLAAMPAPAGKVSKAAELGVFAVVGLTGPTALFVLPVALWRVLTSDRSSRYLWARVVVLAASSVVVALAALVGGRADGNAASVVDLPGYLYVKWGGTLTLGESLMDSSDLTAASPEMVLAGVIIAVLLALALVDIRGPSWIWLSTGLAAAVAGALVGARTGDPGSLLEPRNMTRYSVPLLCVSMAVLVRGVARPGGSDSDKWRRVTAAGGLILVVLGVLGDARLPAAGPATDPAQLASLRECYDGRPPYAEAVGCPVDVVPDGWTLVVLRPGYEELRSELKPGLSGS